MANTVRYGGLGRGLSSLFEESFDLAEVDLEESDDITEGDHVKYIELAELQPNRMQPRKTFDEAKLQELADSLKEHGMIQPIIVRPADAGYEIVAGERRWRAADKAGLERVPCVVRDFTDEENLFIALIENTQREDLNAIEEAQAYHEMIDTYGLTQEQISRSVGRSRPYITNSLRLLRLPQEIQDLVTGGRLSGAHARTLAAVEDTDLQKKLAARSMDGGMSVRSLEKAITDSGKRKARRGRLRDPEIKAAEEKLSAVVGGKVHLPASRKRGKIEISFTSATQLDAIIAKLLELSE